MLSQVPVWGLMLLQQAAAPAGPQFDLMSMFQSMEWPARTVVITLFIMSLLSLVITAERILFFRKSKADSIRFATCRQTLQASAPNSGSRLACAPASSVATKRCERR